MFMNSASGEHVPLCTEVERLRDRGGGGGGENLNNDSKTILSLNDLFLLRLKLFFTLKLMWNECYGSMNPFASLRSLQLHITVIHCKVSVHCLVKLSFIYSGSLSPCSIGTVVMLS